MQRKKVQSGGNADCWDSSSFFDFDIKCNITLKGDMQRFFTKLMNK